MRIAAATLIALLGVLGMVPASACRADLPVEGAPAPAAPAVQPMPATQPAPEATTTSGPALGWNKDKSVFRFEHLTVDLKARTVTMDAIVAQAHYALEFLLCSGDEKAYESVMWTKASPWQVHAGMLMLGLAPGKPGGFLGEAYIPPRGAGLHVKLEWTDEDAKKHQSAATDWVKLSGEGKEKAKPDKFIFVGSDFLPDGTYWANADTGIIAVANLPSAVIDVPFRSAQAIEQRAFVVDTDKVPPKGTVVTVSIQPEKDAEKAPDARALLEIDRFGTMTIDGAPIDRFDDHLRKWAEEFTKKHSAAEVVIRLEALAPAYLASMAQVELKLGGVYEFEHRTAPLYTPPMPMNPTSMAYMLKEWQGRFADPKNQIRDPGDEAEATLRIIETRKAELDRQKELLERYEKVLRQQAEAYRRANPPSGGS